MKATKTALISILFLLVSIMDIYAILVGNRELEMIAKPLITTSLAALYLLSVKKPNFWYVSAVFFCFWGDVLLLFLDKFFVLGLASFLLAHILYIGISSKFLPKIGIPRILVHSIPFIIILVALLYMIYPNLEDLLIPVIVYGIVISVFGVVTFLVYTNQKTTENLWLFLGALIFILSDSVLALNKFYEASEILGISIMITYVVAQYLICKAMIEKDQY